MENLKATNALRPFILLSDSANSPSAAADLITQATSANNAFFFAELLQTPNILSLARSDHASHLTLLQIFSWGTIADYNAAMDLPELNDEQREKLLQLSVMELARQLRSPMPYDRLIRDLGLPSTEALEFLVTSVLRAGLLKGRMDSFNRLFHVYAIPPLRDLAPGSLPAIADAFERWSAECAGALQLLEEEQTRIRKAAKREFDRNQRVQRMFSKKLAMDDDKGASRSKRVLDEKEGGFEDEDAMDLDGEGGKTRSGTKRTLLGLTKIVS
jgi:COP9 signalosome complex subunit 7